MAVYLRINNRFSRCLRCYSSALFALGEKTKEGNLETPHINLAQKFEEMNKLKENIELRKIEMDPIKLKSLWEFFKNLESTKLQLEKRRVEIAEHMRDLMTIGNDAEAKEEMEKLKIEGRSVKEDLKTLMKAFWEVEEKVLINGLSLPNELNKETPEKEDKVVHQYQDRPHFNQTFSHIDIGYKLDLIEFKNQSCYYLKNSAAAFELASSYYFAEVLKSENFISFCNPDFARSIIVEGCGINRNDHNSVFDVASRRGSTKTHLVGGASFYPFCAFHAKQTVNFLSLPLKYFTIGRQYTPLNTEQIDNFSLFCTWQKTAAEIFILTSEDDIELMSQFQKILKTIITAYEKLDIHFRVVYLNASSLFGWESLRASFQMYSCHEQKYIEVGRISISDNYICQRLLMTYQMSDNDNKLKYMKMISGTVLNVPKLLGCILEQRDKDYDKLVIPECLKPYFFDVS